MSHTMKYKNIQAELQDRSIHIHEQYNNKRPNYPNQYYKLCNILVLKTGARTRAYLFLPAAVTLISATIMIPFLCLFDTALQRNALKFTLQSTPSSHLTSSAKHHRTTLCKENQEFCSKINFQ